jgi:hypothetical protein
MVAAPNQSSSPSTQGEVPVEDASLEEGLDPARTLRPGKEQEELFPTDLYESDDDISEGLPEDLELLGEVDASVETTALSTTDRMGEIRATDLMCRVRMAAKTPEGQSIFCGHPADVCKRPKHQQKQAQEDARVPPGVYEGILNKNKSTVDGIVETFVSFEQREAQAQQNLDDMMQTVQTSAQKTQTEDLYHDKTPSAITFKLPDMSPAATPRQDQIQTWRGSLADPPQRAKMAPHTSTAPSLIPVTAKDDSAVTTLERAFMNLTEALPQ